MTTESPSRSDLIVGFVCLLIIIAYLTILSGDLVKGYQTLSWPEVPATTIVAYHHREYNPEIAGFTRFGGYKLSQNIALAYTTPDSGYFVTWDYDVASLSTAPELFVRPSVARVKHIINEGEAARVYYNPNQPDEAVMYRGIPYTTGAALFVPLSLLVVIVRLFGRSKNEPGSKRQKGQSFSALIWLPVVLVFEFFAFGFSNFWIWTNSEMPPWWVLVLGSVGLPLIAIFWRLLPRTLSHGLVACFLFFGILLGIIGSTRLDTESFGLDWTDAEFVERLDHPHPAVGKYAAVHFFKTPAPDKALDPLRRLVLHSPSSDARLSAAQVLRRMEERAIPALPDLQQALVDPANELIRDDLAAVIKTLDNIRRFRERNPGYDDK